MSVIYYVNGQFVSEEDARIPIEERGHQFGDGVYEVVRVYGGRPFLLDWHLERLNRSCQGIGLVNPFSQDEWTELIAEAIRRSGEAEAQVYWQITRGIAPRGHLFPSAAPSVTLSVRPLTVAKTESRQPQSLLCFPDERWSNPWIKTINLLPNVLAKEAAHRTGAAEALLVREGDITEGSSSNAWFIKGTELFTAPANRYILPGVTRRFVLELARSIGYTVYEHSVSLDDLKDVDEVFMTSTSIEILPINAILGDEGRMSLLYQLPDVPSPSLLRIPNQLTTVWSGTSDSVVRRLQDGFAKAVERFRNYDEPILQ